MMRLILVTLFTASLFLNGILIRGMFSGNDTPVGADTSSSLSYPHLSKRIFRDDPNDILINFVPLRSALNERVPHIPFPVNVYFEYLPTGSSIGINEKDEIVQASLIKVPAVMAVYKAYEEGKLRPDQRVTLTKDDLDKDFGTLWQKGEGYELTVEDAVKLSVIDSDNTSYRLIRRLLDPSALDTVMNSLDIPIEVDGELPVVSAKNYSSILRSLYLSYYLKPEHSNEILDLLTKSSMKDMLAGGVPQDVAVAHKFGEHSTDDTQASVHNDCGIVYVPERPYILCMFGKGERDTVRAEMRRISKMVYEYVIRVQAPK